MVRDMIAVGYPPPDTAEVPGLDVRAALVGDPLGEGWVSFLSCLEPAELRGELNALLLLRRQVSDGWVDVDSARPVLQMSEVETAATLYRLRDVTLDGDAVINVVDGVPAGAPVAWGSPNGGVLS